jgi:hypothetical protein
MDRQTDRWIDRQTEKADICTKLSSYYKDRLAKRKTGSGYSDGNMD